MFFFIRKLYIYLSHLSHTTTGIPRMCCLHLVNDTFRLPKRYVYEAEALCFNGECIGNKQYNKHLKSILL